MLLPVVVVVVVVVVVRMEKLKGSVGVGRFGL